MIQDSLPLTLRGNTDHGARPYDHSMLALAGKGWGYQQFLVWAGGQSIVYGPRRRVGQQSKMDLPSTLSLNRMTDACKNVTLSRYARTT